MIDRSPRHAVRRLVGVSRLATVVVTALSMHGPVLAQVLRDDDADSADARREKLERVVDAAIADYEARPDVLAGLDPRRLDEADRRVVRVLRDTRLSFDFAKTPLDEVIAALQKSCGVTFVITQKLRDWIDEESPELSFVFRDLKLSSLLNLIARGYDQVRFRVHEGAIVAEHRSEHRPRVVLRTYDVRDIVRPPRHFPAPKVGLATDETR